MRAPMLLALSVSSLALGFTAAPAHAQADSAGTSPDTVPDIIVTAQKRNEREQDVPISSTTFTEDRLEKLGADSFLDYAKYVPSMSFASLGPGQSDIVLRGIPIIEGVPTVGIYVDGVSIASGFTNPDPRLFDVRDVQVLRGPQGTLYGEGAIGGLIIIRNNQPNPKEFEGKLDATVSWTDRAHRANVELNAMLNVPIVSDKLALRLVGFRRDYAGYIDQVSTGMGLVGSISAPQPAIAGGSGRLVKRDANTEQVTGGRASLGFTPSDDFSLTLSATLQETRVGGDNYIMPTTRALFFPSASDYSVFEDFRTERKDRYLLLSGELVKSFGWATLTGDFGYFDRKIYIDRAYTLSSLNTVPGSSDSDPKQVQTEWRLASAGEHPFQWLVGARYTDGTNHIRQTTDITGYDFLRAVDQSTRTWAVFGEGAYTLPGTSLTARVGLRYFDQRTTMSSLIRDSLQLIANPSPAQSRVATATDVSPRFVLEYKIDGDHLLYASVAKGFRAGGVNVDLCNSGCPTPNFQPTYNPDYIWTYEAGAKTDWFDHRLRFNAAFFYSKWDHLQIDGDPSHSSTGFVTNAGKAHSIGAEADAFITPAKGLTFNLGGSLLRSVLDEPAMGAPAGTRLPNTPRWTFNAGFDYSHPLAGTVRFLLHGDVAARGNAFGNIPNIPQSATNAAYQFVLRNEAEGFTTVNTRVGVEGRNWSLTAFVENITNSRASSFNFNDNAVFGAFGFYSELDYIARPRTTGLQARIQF